MAEITDFGPRKTIFILAIVAGCFAVLWPKIFYPMLTASVTPHHTTSDSSACCEVIFESDVNAVDIMQEMCQNILRHHQVDPRVREVLKSRKLTPQSANLCREEVLARCGIDLSSFLAERERLGKTYKQVLEEIRSFNSSLCLKVHFGVPLSQLGTPHLIRYHILMPHNTIRQERRTPPHAGGLHPALRERGRAIPSAHIVPKIVDRPDHVVPKMRPPLGGAGHVVPPPKGNGTMGIIMPLYTLGIVLFFLYTIVKVIKKSSDSEIISEYPSAAAEKEFRKMVFSPELLTTAMTGGTVQYQKESSPLMQMPAPTIEELKDQAAGDIEIDQLRRRLVETEAAMERIVVQMGNISRSVISSPSSQPDLKESTTGQESRSQADEDVENLEQSPTVKVMGMEMTASCEGGQKCSRPTTPIIPPHVSQPEREMTPPKSIYLEGALPPECELLVTESEIETQKVEEDDAEAPVVLSGKMTLSLISLDQIAAESGDEGAVVEEERAEKILDESAKQSEISDGEDKEPDDGSKRVALYKEMVDTREAKQEDRKKEMVMTEESNKMEVDVSRVAQQVREHRNEREIILTPKMETEQERKEQSETEEEDEEVEDEISDSAGEGSDGNVKLIQIDDDGDEVEKEEEEEDETDDEALRHTNVKTHCAQHGVGQNQVLSGIRRKDELSSKSAMEEEEDDDESEDDEDEVEGEDEHEGDDEDEEDEDEEDDEEDEEEDEIEVEEEQSEVEHETEEEEEDEEYDDDEEEEDAEETEEEVEDIEESDSDEEEQKKRPYSERVHSDKRN